MNAFNGLGAPGAASTLQAVAPGISEALVATAIGLAAAIPAAIAYNYFAVGLQTLSRIDGMFHRGLYRIEPRSVGGRFQ